MMGICAKNLVPVLQGIASHRFDLVDIRIATLPIYRALGTRLWYLCLVHCGAENVDIN